MMLFEYIFVNYLVFCEYYVRGKDGGRGGGVKCFWDKDIYICIGWIIED